ncbi:alpha-tubulin N-acetyltransferase [Phytophthora cinnamomi]|uniref:alpha-tubulin N-acetyltransferase n=1 Tax=Phytophthora cinnamomi TaxID=4785 RepID=UPI00355A6D9E|nr:alpha-tubulin N-acetyltransferase [Phytophthora cinnamomi]
MWNEIEVLRAPEPLGPALAEAVDELGWQSALAQALSHAITSAALFASPGAAQQRQRLLLAKDDGGCVVGFLKTGVKHLFYVSHTGQYIEMDPICVLDFYVDEAWQRRGVGLQLFQRLLQDEQVTPAQLAYDRPSPKLFAFLEKHAGLTEYFPQPNRFVVFDAYFHSRQ